MCVEVRKMFGIRPDSFFFFLACQFMSGGLNSFFFFRDLYGSCYN